MEAPARRQYREQVPPALEQLYASEVRYVYAFLHRLGGRGCDLEDLVHDVFVTAVRRFGDYDPSRPARPWLLGIAFRVMSDWRRKPRPATEELPELRFEGPGGEERVQQREARDLLTEALSGLSEERRAALVMYELEKLSVAEISEAMGCPLATTYTRLRTARDELAAAVRRIQLRQGER
jgi:RNA polymerase sigma-70 factor (ECF subfamily)